MTRTPDYSWCPIPTPSFFEHGGSRSVNEIREHLTWIGDCMMAAPLEHTYAMWLLPAAPLLLCLLILASCAAFPTR